MDELAMIEHFIAVGREIAEYRVFVQLLPVAHSAHSPLPLRLLAT